jgi:hypothetical protein
MKNNFIQNDEIFLKIKVIKKSRKKIKSTRVDSTNSPLITLDEDKKTDFQKKNQTKKKPKLKKIME